VRKSLLLVRHGNLFYVVGQPLLAAAHRPGPCIRRGVGPLALITVLSRPLSARTVSPSDFNATSDRVNQDQRHVPSYQGSRSANCFWQKVTSPPYYYFFALEILLHYRPSSSSSSTLGAEGFHIIHSFLPISAV